ncbi:hypothetical protein CK203_110074 [Vitis vinifera]|uniref:Uncharacterized protein n=1 Tax=Vitis vinifera TaxID=29760 RepID=A0A438ERV8_VITVI|nr:hypothetical protein CK203_110074 [Vitis vinifera]
MESLNEKSHLLEVVRFLDSSKNRYLIGRSNHICRILDQWEYHKEIQTLDYDYHISEEDESGQSELVNQKDVFTEIPNQSSSVEGVLNLEPDPFMKRLPHRHNRGSLTDPRWKAIMNEEMKSL